jgi:hypothetical protein
VVVVGYTRTWAAGSPIAYTVTYRAEDGHWRWGRRYGDPSQGEVGLGEVLVSWDGTRVYGSGGGNYPSTFGRFRLTIAYAA